MAQTKLLTIIMAALFLLAVSLAIPMAELYFMSAVLGAIPLISYILGRYALKSLECVRHAPGFASEGELLTISLSVRGWSRLLGPIRIEDTLPEWITHAGSEDESGAFRIGTAAGLPDSSMSADGITFSYSAVPVKRGCHRIGPVRICATDPLGLFEFRSSCPIVSQITTFPTPIYVRDLGSVSGGEFGDTQFEGSGAKGSGIDFHGVREYQPGDELRRVYWKSTARHGRLNVIEFEHSLAEDTMIAIDLKRGSEIGHGPYSSLECAVRLAAGLASDAIAHGSAARLAGSGLDAPVTTLGKGKDHLYSILNALALVEADQPEPLSSVLLHHMEDIPRGSVVVCLTPSVDSRLTECAALLRAKQVKMIVVLVCVLPDLPERLETHMAELIGSGALVTAVACSPDGPMVRVLARYAA